MKDTESCYIEITDSPSPSPPFKSQRENNQAVVISCKENCNYRAELFFIRGSPGRA